MNGITISVDYSDILEITLKRNIKHFKKFVVVTSHADFATVEVCSRVPGVVCYQTSAFYSDGAIFRKWLALEEGLDVLGRSEWISVIDADIVLPNEIDFSGATLGNLYTPRRRMLTDITKWREHVDGERDWSDLPLKRNEEFAGYFQLFHASDPVLHGKKHWYGIDWVHAGGGDSEMAAHWPLRNRVRPPFEVLHLGEDGKNWCGRATMATDGTICPEASGRTAKLEKLLATRKQDASFRAEKIRIPAEAKLA